MYFKNKLFILSIIIILILNVSLLSGCNNNDVETINNEVSTLQKELEDSKNLVKMLRNKNDESKNQIKDLNKKIEELGKEVFYYLMVNDNVKNFQKYISMINENKNNIKNVEPKYLLNVYDPLVIKKGDKYADLVVDEVNVKTAVNERFKKNINICTDVSIKFKGVFNLKGKIYNDIDLVQIMIDKSQFNNIPINIEHFYDSNAPDHFNDSKVITIMNGDELIKALGDKYKNGMEVTAKFNGYWYHALIESEYHYETEFAEIITIHK